MKRRVVVTGLGAVTPLGIGAEKTWKALCAGKSGIGRISRFDTTNFQTKIAGEVKDFDPEDFLDKKQVRRMDSFV
ncbi:MAG TPA: beta-ketoacyl-[acyl-carrier-protein] synthase II, partial [Deltaproteobacteria bacterium]|nr:beta-ketoacyl-[acyl-carrier-protein] synthase II [Deltaproteobacteria bacterium]